MADVEVGPEAPEAWPEMVRPVAISMTVESEHRHLNVSLVIDDPTSEMVSREIGKVEEAVAVACGLGGTRAAARIVSRK